MSSDTIVTIVIAAMGVIGALLAAAAKFGALVRVIEGLGEPGELKASVVQHGETIKDHGEKIDGHEERIDRVENKLGLKA